MAGNQWQNAGPPEVEWLATGAEYRDTGAECRPPEQSTGTQEQNAGQREQNRRIWKEKSAQLWGLRAFTICFAAWATLRKGANLLGATLQKGAILPRSGLHLPAGQGCGRPPVPTACADRLCRLCVPTCRTRLRAGPDADGGVVSRTCTGRRARWLGILPFRVCRRGLRCCGFSPLRGARILSCLSQGT